MPSVEEARNLLKVQMRAKLFDGKNRVPEFTALSEDKKIIFLDGYDAIIDKYNPLGILTNPWTRRKFKKDMKELEKKVYGNI